LRIAPRFRQRAARTSHAGRKVAWVIAAAAVIVGVALIVVALDSRDAAAPRKSVSTTAATLASVSIDATGAAGRAEVPRVIGSTLAEARVVLSAAGFRVVLLSGSDVGTQSVVSSQRPDPGTVAPASSVVTLTTVASAAPTTTVSASSRRRIVVIDPGHQAHSDSSPEPIGPGSKITKPAVSGGTTGVETDIPEFEIALQIATNLSRRLEAAGVEVVMTRTTNDVNISNAQRAAIANKAGADLFVRVHADGSPDRGRSGISTLYPASNSWTKTTWQRSQRAAAAVQAATVRETQAVDLGIVARGDISGFNYARMPSVLIECGFMSNPVEDRLLASPRYQDKLAEGISEGVLRYLSESGR
jgi:N-acetylmuramoyl-L-alanine amidase